MKRLIVGGVLLVLAGCGVDGPPEPVDNREPGIKLTGTVSAGVSGSF